MMAVGARWHIRVALRHGAAVHAACVRRRDTLMAARAGLRHGVARCRGLPDVVRSMAVDAHRCRAIAARDGLLVHAVERFRVVGEMTLAALRVHRQREVTPADESALWMR